MRVLQHALQLLDRILNIQYILYRISKIFNLIPHIMLNKVLAFCIHGNILVEIHLILDRLSCFIHGVIRILHRAICQCLMLDTVKIHLRTEISNRKLRLIIVHRNIRCCLDLIIYILTHNDLTGLRNIIDAVRINLIIGITVCNLFDCKVRTRLSDQICLIAIHVRYRNTWCSIIQTTICQAKLIHTCRYRLLICLRTCQNTIQIFRLHSV